MIVLLCVRVTVRVCEWGYEYATLSTHRLLLWPTRHIMYVYENLELVLQANCTCMSLLMFYKLRIYLHTLYTIPVFSQILEIPSVSLEILVYMVIFYFSCL